MASRGPAVRIALSALGYVVVARFSLYFVVQPEGVASFWPPSGYFLGVLLLTPRKEWPAQVAALFAANALTNGFNGTPVLPSLGFALANCVESLCAAWLMQRALGMRLTMGRLKEVMGLVALAAVASNMATALLGASVPALAFGAPFWMTWRLWWISASAGMLLVTPVIVSWADISRKPLRELSFPRVVEGSLLFLSMSIVAGIIFRSPGDDLARFLPLPYATFPFLMWAAVRFGPRGGSLGSLLLAMTAVYYTSRGTGPFAVAVEVPSMVYRMLLVQAFLSVAVVCSLMLGTVIDERRRADEALRTAYADLEQRIQARTLELSAANLALQSEVAIRTRAEAQVRRTLAELARSNAELQEFAYVASHDLQEPLRAVTGTVQLLQQRYQDQLDSRANDLIQHAVEGASRMKSFIIDLLSYSRVGRGGLERKPTDIPAVVKNVLANLAISVNESGAAVTYQGVASVMAEAAQLGQLVQNLV
ncbi:MAG TPA: MASE1 domain-containing protein, partial [Myxococcaceae bacterium]